MVWCLLDGEKPQRWLKPVLVDGRHDAQVGCTCAFQTVARLILVPFSVLSVAGVPLRSSKFDLLFGDILMHVRMLDISCDGCRLASHSDPCRGLGNFGTPNLAVGAYGTRAPISIGGPASGALPLLEPA